METPQTVWYPLLPSTCRAIATINIVLQCVNLLSISSVHWIGKYSYRVMDADIWHKGYANHIARLVCGLGCRGAITGSCESMRKRGILIVDDGMDMIYPLRCQRRTSSFPEMIIYHINKTEATYSSPPLCPYLARRPPKSATSSATAQLDEIKGTYSRQIEVGLAGRRRCLPHLRARPIVLELAVGVVHLDGDFDIRALRLGGVEPDVAVRRLEDQFAVAAQGVLDEGRGLDWISRVCFVQLDGAAARRALHVFVYFCRRKPKRLPSHSLGLHAFPGGTLGKADDVGTARRFAPPAVTSKSSRYAALWVITDIALCDTRLLFISS
ncbi:hypothetical protein AB1N83_013691 [Pleurotus pulmonarius]